MPKQKTLMLLFTACLALLALAACSSAAAQQPQLACWPAAGEVTGEYGWTRLGWRTGMQMQLAEAAPVQSAAAGEVVSVAIRSRSRSTMAISCAPVMRSAARRWSRRATRCRPAR